MTSDGKEKLSQAQKLMAEFLQRTGIGDDQGDKTRRYLWTDAFAVQACLGLAGAVNNRAYLRYAAELVEEVHHRLGKFRADDPRQGWISGLEEKEGELHPTAGGLRIGKKLPERKPGEPFDERREWKQDGQYFHYLTRWFSALLNLGRETGQAHYLVWAVELCLAWTRFIDQTADSASIYWKLSTDLTYPLVNSMGAHDPLEGLICALSVRDQVAMGKEQLEELIDDFAKICRGKVWATDDPLGIGGLLLNAARAELLARRFTLPESIRSRKLLAEGIAGLRFFLDRSYDPSQKANSRLAFRECGLALGLRVITGLEDQAAAGTIDEKFKGLNDLASEIENFWLLPQNQKSDTWTEHLDINAVMLASSIIARHSPRAFV